MDSVGTVESMGIVTIWSSCPSMTNVTLTSGVMTMLVEPDINTYQIDDRLIEKAVTPRTKAVMIVHLYGCCAYTEKIGEICKKYNLKLLEDNAQAHGCLYNDRRTGSLGDAAAHSFYPGKNLEVCWEKQPPG